MSTRDVGRMVRDAFGENVPVEQTRRKQVFRRLTVQTSSAGAVSLPPLQLADYMPEEVDEVRVGLVENLTDGTATPSAAVSAFWRMVGARRVLVEGFSGLANSSKYRVTLVAE